MSNVIDSIKLSGTVYTLSAQTSGGGSPTVELTQAQYDALVTAGTVAQDTYYIITDAQVGDLTQYWTSAQTQSAITQAVSGKQDQLVSGTNIKTINNESILGSGNIVIQGGVTIDPSLDSGSTNAVANSAITTAINDKAGKSQAYGSTSFGTSSGKEYVRFEKVNGTRDSERYISKINGFSVWGTTNANACKNWELVETSAITTSVTSSSTDAEVPSAKAVYDKLGGLSLVKLTQSAYDALSPNYDSNTLYIIKD